MKKSILIVVSIATLFLLVSTATALPQTQSEILEENIKNLVRVEPKFFPGIGIVVLMILLGVFGSFLGSILGMLIWE